LSDLIKAINATYGPTITIVIMTIVIVYAIFFALLPFFYWSVYKRTTKATEELTGLKILIENLKHQTIQKKRLRERSSEEKQLKEISKDKQIETLPKDKLPESDYARRKVFHETNDDSTDDSQTMEPFEEGYIKPFPVRPPY
jgi:hypothetical protein